MVGLSRVAGKRDDAEEINLVISDGLLIATYDVMQMITAEVCAVQYLYYQILHVQRPCVTHTCARDPSRRLFVNRTDGREVWRTPLFVS